MGKTSFYVDIMAQHQAVTGSLNLFVIHFPDGTKRKLLIDCGLFQEPDYVHLNNTFIFDSNEIDYVLISHNHTDHIGRLPLLIAEGYNGKIHMTHTTHKLIPHALGDTYKLTRTRAKLAHKKSMPFTRDDVDTALARVVGHNFNDPFYLDDNIRVTFFKNGHLAGAASILVQISYHDPTERHYEDINIFFTGDYNNKNMFFKVPNLPKWVRKLPVNIVTESTYGDVNSSEIEYIFEKTLLDKIAEEKHVIIPVFSLGRSQELMLVLKRLQEADKLDKSIPIYYDGKLGRTYTELYEYDGLDNEIFDFYPDNFHFISDLEMRREIMADKHQKIILTTSGMGTHGPAETYLPAFIKRHDAAIIFTGYCSEGTKGRELIEAEHGTEVYGVKEDENGNKILTGGPLIRKIAEVYQTSEFSGHAKADELIEYINKFENIKFIVTQHGAPATQIEFAERLVREVKANDVGILSSYVYRVDGYGYVKSFGRGF